MPLTNIEDILRREPNDAIIALSEAISHKCSYGDKLEALSDAEKVFYYNQIFEMEVNNGGFDQYFFNTNDEYTSETIRSLRLIGAENTASILQEAATIDRSKELLDVNGFSDLEERFYRYEDDLNSLNLKFVEANKAEFSIS